MWIGADDQFHNVDVTCTNVNMYQTTLKCMQNRKMQSFTYDMSMQSANILYLLGKPVKGNVEKYIIWKLEIKRPLASPARQ